GRRRVELTEAGRALVVADRGGPATEAAPVLREELVCQALTGLYLFQKGDDYLVREGKIEIIDENTGRSMPDRAWMDGLNQLIEIKEGCRTSPPRQVRAQITFQQLFRRYLHLSGMTGTAREAASELARVYGVRVTRIPPNRPSQRRSMGT